MLLPFFFVCVILHFVEGWTNPCLSSTVSTLPFCDSNLSFEERATDLVYTQEPKISNYLYYLQNATRADSDKHGFPALNIQGYDFHHEALHGLRGPKNVTQFPQVITTGATFNESLFFMIGDAISTESRAIFNKQHGGLTYWAPNVNIFRDPRWGRGQETPGEDPFVTSRYAIGFVTGMQGSDSKYLKTSACCKHFADYSVESNRHGFNAIVSQYDQNDTYLVAFQSCVLNANVSGIMCSYNSVNGVPSCADKDLLNKYLRNELNFYGYITSDCGGVNDVQNSHHYTNSTDATIAAVFSAGMDLDCGTYTLTNNNTVHAINHEAVPVSVIQQSRYHATLIQMRLGLFDNSSLLPTKWNALNRSDVSSPSHLEIAYTAAQQGQVLLKNRNNTLPLSNRSGSISSVALIGPNANNTLVMEGSYYGSPGFIYSVYDGLKEYISAENIHYEQGCLINKGNTSGFQAAIAAAKKADVTIMVMGLDGSQEGEMHDRKNLLLPGFQNELIEQVSTASKGKTILVILSGGCVDISNQTYNIGSNKIDGIIWGGYPGMYGGLAVADVIFGTFNPTGRLSQTFYYNNYTTLMEMGNFNMRPNINSSYGISVGRGYRYYPGSVLYPFGTGLSYSSFQCDTLSVNKDELLTAVTNTGNVDGGAVVLVYFIPNDSGGDNPLKRLVGFGRINMIKVGNKQQITMKMYQQFYYSQERQNGGKYVLSGACGSV